MNGSVGRFPAVPAPAGTADATAQPAVPRPATNGSFHLVSDFDGVWTEPAREALAVHRTVAGELARLAGRPLDWIEERLQEFGRAVRAAPHDYGWRIDGRLASYVDEDFFCQEAALGQYLERAPQEPAAELRAAVLREFPSLAAFMDSCYHGTCARFREEVPHDLTRGAEPVLRWLLARPARVTFVTNAPAGKVIDWFAHHGLRVGDAREEAAGGQQMRVYGRAGKQYLGASGQMLDFAGRPVHVDRPHYRAILEQERPDLVLGDVLSLDLAVPIAMRLAGSPGAPRATALIWRRDTPEWILRSVGEGSHQVNHLLAHVTELPRLAQGLAPGHLTVT